MVRKSQGFTLIELLTTVTIVVILSVIGYPSYTYLVAQNHAKGAADALFMSLLKARSTAATMNLNITIAPVVSGNWASGWQVSCITSSSNDCQNGTSNIVYTNEAALSGVTISAAATNVVYLTSGRTSGAANFSITAQTAGKTVQMCVAVDSGGHPYVTSALCTGS